MNESEQRLTASSGQQGDEKANDVRNGIARFAMHVLNYTSLATPRKGEKPIGLAALHRVSVPTISWHTPSIEVMIFELGYPSRQFPEKRRKFFGRGGFTTETQRAVPLCDSEVNL
jgi:hypothetical protein